MQSQDALKTGQNWRHLTKFLFAILVVQAAYWLAFYPNFVSPDGAPFERYEVTEMEFSKIRSPDAEGLAHASYAPAPKSPLIVQKRGYYSWKFNADLPVVPEEGLGLLPNGGADNIRLFANGHLIFGEGKMNLPNPTYDFVAKPRIRIPAAALVEGKNTFELVQVVELSRETLNFPSILGDYKTIEKVSDWRLFLFRDANVISATVGFVIAFFAFVALLRSNSKNPLIWFFVLTLLWPLRSLFLIWTELPLYGAGRPLLYGFVTLSFSAAWPLFVNAWSARPNRLFVLGNGLIWAAGILAITYWVLLSQATAPFTQVEEILNYLGIAFMISTVIRLIWHFVSIRDDRYWEAAILVLLVSLLGLFLIYALLWDQHKSFLDLGQPLLLFAFAIAFFSRNIRLFQSSAQINELLQTELTERTADLEAAHQRETILVRTQAHHDERQRIMRDMHDGLGSNLMSMLLAAQRGQADPQTVADGLQSMVDEMRLMIDSMDTVGESLATAMATFRERVQSRVESAGFAFHWNNSAGRNLPSFGSRRVLQIFRIMQEAVTNALRHSAGDQITVEIRQSNAQDNVLLIAISDNGTGFTARRIAGRGLDNMQSRAATIGVELSIQKGDAGGTIVVLALPASIHKDPQIP